MDKPLFRCRVSADIFRRAWTCISKEDTRYYLNGVHIEPHPSGGALLVATDGHKLVAIRDADGLVENGPAIVRVNKVTLSALKKPVAPSRVKDEGEMEIFVHGSRLAVAPSKAAVFAAGDEGDILTIVDQPTQQVVAYQWCDSLIDGTFPDWKRLIPTENKEGHVPPFNPRQLAAVAEALGGPDGDALHLVATSTDDRDPFLVVGEKIDGFAVIMPRRFTSKAQPLAWATPMRATPKLSEVAA